MISQLRASTSMILANNIPGLIAIAENFGSFICRILQVFLVILVIILLFVFSLFYLNNLFRRQKLFQSSYQFDLYFWAGIFILYNLVYNYVMANRMGPGHPEDIPQQILKNNNVYKRCRKCNGIKPVRAHHCSICDSCNLQMDHHCPWMGTCIGHQNRAYFINFLTYLTIGSYLVVHVIQKLHLRHDEVYMFLYTIFWVIGVFTMFHWGIALIGRTTLESISIMDGYKPQTFNIPHNFEIVFGTKNPIIALLPISTKFNKFLGYEWNGAIQFPQSLFPGLEDQVDSSLHDQQIQLSNSQKNNPL